MGRQKRFTVEDTLDKVIDVYLARGYRATAVRELVSATKLHPGSLYHAFGNKQQLFGRALERFNETSGFAQTIAPAETAPPRETIVKMFDVVIASASGGSRGCLISNTAVEVGKTDSELGEQLGRYFEHMEERIATLIERGQQLGEFASQRPARQLARLVLSTVQGIQILSKVSKDPATLRDAANMTLAVLDGDGAAQPDK